MEHFDISRTEAGLHIEGFPDAVKILRVEGPRAKRLADLALHRADLDFAENCLDGINQVPEEPHFIREALWRSAIVHVLKCFGDSGARFQLSADTVLRGQPPEAMMAYDYFKGLRNKHLVHDENSYAQSIPGAILNKGDKEHKIEKIVCFSAIVGTLSQESYSNLKLLIQKASSWVVAEFDQLCDALTKELEKEPYEKLLGKDSLSYRVPTIDEIHKNRNAPSPAARGGRAQRQRAPLSRTLELSHTMNDLHNINEPKSIPAIWADTRAAGFTMASVEYWGRVL